MSVVVVVLPRLEDSKKIRTVLNNHGISQVFACATASAALNEISEHDQGLVLSGYRLKDMYYRELQGNLPPGFELILMGSANAISQSEAGILSLEMPLKVYELIDTVEMVLYQMERRKKKAQKPKRRSEQEEKYIKEAKYLLMERNHLTEEEAHRYIQKHSMDNATNMVETAQMILTLLYEEG